MAPLVNASKNVATLNVRQGKSISCKKGNCHKNPEIGNNIISAKISNPTRTNNRDLSAGLPKKKEPNDKIAASNNPVPINKGGRTPNCQESTSSSGRVIKCSALLAKGV